MGRPEEGWQDIKGSNESISERSSIPHSAHSAPTAMDILTGHNTRAPEVDDKSSAELHDRVVDAHEMVSAGTVDAISEDEEDKMKKLHDAEELLRRTGQEQGKAGAISGTSGDKGIDKPKSTSLQRNLPSEGTMQKEAGAEGEVTTLADSAHLGPARAPLGMPTREDEKQTDVPGNLHEQYFMECEAGAEGEVTTMGEVGDLGAVRPPQGMEELTGVGGVTFSMQPGEGGILPGYPTAEGMSKMLQQRMVDDQIRQARAAGALTFSLPSKYLSNKLVQVNNVSRPAQILSGACLTWNPGDQSKSPHPLVLL